MSADLYEVYIETDGDYLFDAAAVEHAVLTALQAGGAPPPVALTVVVTSAEEVLALNQKFAGLDYTTDVLTFPAEEEPYATEPDEPPYLGDIAIAYPVAEAQAEEHGVTLINELQRLAVHGTLHLLGYDHDVPERDAEMRGLEATVMTAL
ncbi:MAG: rRNA maturation RNase YbeY [Anaerolineae bacterium]|nr:rRNA maturation RNase YbeY [Anaerolineae bacterium]